MLQKDAPSSTDLKCAEHDDTDCILVCMDCTVGLCIKCSKTMATCPHREHQLAELAEAKALMRQKFDDQMEEVCSHYNCEHGCVAKCFQCRNSYMYACLYMERISILWCAVVIIIIVVISIIVIIIIRTVLCHCRYHPSPPLLPPLLHIRHYVLSKWLSG